MRAVKFRNAARRLSRGYLFRFGFGLKRIAIGMLFRLIHGDFFMDAVLSDR
jgi:hypothetical protein